MPVLFIAPIPPPVHGGALAMQYLLPLAEQVGMRHLNSQFAVELADLGRFSLGKVGRLLGYCAQLVREVVWHRVQTVVVTPTFHLGPFLKDAVFIWLSAGLLRRRTVAWLHMDFSMMRFETRPAPLQWFVKQTLLRCDRFVVVSEGLKGLLPGWIPPGRVDAIANGVEVPDPLPPGRPEDGRVRLLYLSNLEQAKGWRVILAAVRVLCREFPQLEFVLHGRPAFKETAESIRREIAEDNAGGRIVYGGPVYGQEKWRAFASADVFCFPSLNEALPLAVLEAMAAGLPIVATRVGAVADALEAGAGGMLVAPGDVEGMAGALRQLVGDDRLRRRYGAFNRQRFEERYTLECYQQRWLQWLAADRARTGPGQAVNGAAVR